MADNTKIEWTDATWNPIKARRRDNGRIGWHCERISEGCRHCYAAALNLRTLPNAGTGLDYTSSAREQVEIFIDEKTLRQPLRWRKPRRISVCSATDLFGEFVPSDLIDRVFAVMSFCYQHTFQVLTKRPMRAYEYLTNATQTDNLQEQMDRLTLEVEGEPFAFQQLDEPGRWPLPNVWIGVSAEDQRTMNERIPVLLSTPAAVRFVSLEPLLGPVDLMSHLDLCCAGCGEYDGHHADPTQECGPVWRMYGGRLSWVIVGGESGPQARPLHPDWVRAVRDQCAEFGVPFFFKQWGACVPVSQIGDEDLYHGAIHRMNGAQTEDGTFILAGKARAGRFLDAREHNEYPVGRVASPDVQSPK